MIKLTKAQQKICIALLENYAETPDTALTIDEIAGRINASYGGTRNALAPLPNILRENQFPFRLRRIRGEMAHEPDRYHFTAAPLIPPNPRNIAPLGKIENPKLAARLA